MMLTRCYPNRNRALGHNLGSLMSDFDRFFGDWSTSSPTAEGHFQPAADIVETEDEYTIQVDLPGVKKDDVKLEIKENVLTLSAEKKLENEVEDENVRRKERVFGSFSRSFRFRRRIDHDKVAARYEDGVLEITVPKAEESKPRSIEVKVG
jgi:HSP20 family protein